MSEQDLNEAEARETDLAEQLAATTTRVAALELAHEQLRTAYTQAVREAESAENRRRIAWARHYSARRATTWIIATILQQCRYGQWRPPEIAELLADLASLWEQEADQDPQFRRAHAPASWYTILPRLGFDLLRRVDQWEAVDIAITAMPFARSSSKIQLDRVTFDPARTGDLTDEQRESNHQAFLQVLAALQHGATDLGDPISWDGEERDDLH